jgi:hypothetical protein
VPAEAQIEARGLDLVLGEWPVGKDAGVAHHGRDGL